MGNASRQSKQKQQTSKSVSPALVREEDKIPAVPESIRLNFSVQQANLIKQLLAASQEAQAQLQFALIAAGIDERDIVGGDLDSPTPFLMVSNIDGTVGD
tara:strand:- start:470 stop:769 length:300 start_codon:yes stop_codon:yes gene_type:complete